VPEQSQTDRPGPARLPRPQWPIPPGFTTLPPDGNPIDPLAPPDWGWAAILLDDLEQGNLRRQIDFNRSIVQAPVPVRTHPLKIYRCPADDAVDDFASGALVLEDLPFLAMFHTVATVNVAHANYLGVFGTGPLSATGRPADGVFYRDSRTRLTDIADGTSTTLLVGERSSDLGLATWTGAVTRGHVLPQRPGADPNTAADRAGLVLGRCANEPGRGPNSSASRPEDFASRHSGGVHFAFADGSVRFLASSILPANYAALATRAGNEVVEAP
jgi:prepilin-type processing-associated H-X9-DG protein